MCDVAKVREPNLVSGASSQSQRVPPQAAASGAQFPRQLAWISALYYLTGCTGTCPEVLCPGGMIAEQQRHLLFTATGLMLIVAIPVFVMCAAFAWHFRASNTRATYRPDWDYSMPLEVVIWSVPAALIGVLGTLVWIFSHRLDPYRPLHSRAAPIEVQVIAQDWKWLFLYPKQGIAVVNELVFPSERPLALALTSDTVMNAFDIPGLGGQIYVMAGMRTKLHLKADAPREFVGRNVQFSGAGFSQQQFSVRAVEQGEFESWVAHAKDSSRALDDTAYSALRRSSTAEPIKYYSSYRPDLFDQIVARYAIADPEPQPSVTTAMPPEAHH